MKSLMELDGNDLVYIITNGDVHGTERVENAIPYVQNYAVSEVFTAVKDTVGPVTAYEVQEQLLDSDSIYKALHPDVDIVVHPDSYQRIADCINAELQKTNTFYKPGEKVSIDSVLIKECEKNTKRRNLIRLYNRVFTRLPEEIVDQLLAILGPLDAKK